MSGLFATDVERDKAALERVVRGINVGIHPLRNPIRRSPNRPGRLRHWRWMHRLYRGGKLLIETIHASEGSIYLELQASASRVARGEATRVEAGVIEA